jgi:pyruvate/2-oxoglutarate dehydrogenase complex dihydrolipoamide acyltransferase (E2) component
VVTRLPFQAVRAGVAMGGTIARVAAALGPPVGVSSLGMFAAGWAIPISPLTVMVTVGGVAYRPALLDGQLFDRVVLPLTLSFDHTVVDGAPAARFAATLIQALQRP